ncbi:thiamine pyrophosphate-dependent enzyme [Weeksellaceae bacterium KMM 9713]|uniref:Thiamine pyrophosphate-dependent enzyme n=1 Tax=Profundicola chukchiensis TaxID=2961959 RepID=A0A9X4N0T0_9FLAO|nr:transketolase C-terminal domain-containing protein [Profundicola chukchiensis]MDG4946685.1 thiamine pyrophosphate-dependent enzyme [Profundicola chukchiensis]
MHNENILNQEISFDIFKEEILHDYYLARLSRETSLLGRREVLTGKAKFGIFGDGKELPQIAMAKVFKNGDFRSGYYRDQTFMMAIEQLTIEGFFAQLYAVTDENVEKASSGRQMTSHFATHSLNRDGSWKKLTEQKNSSADISPTAGQMPRLVGLAQASKYYRNHPEADQDNNFSISGNEIAFGTIGDASTSEGHFWESINAAGVLQVPMIISIWDDEYGISVGHNYQRTKKNLSEMLKGFQRTDNERGYEIITTYAHDYPHLVESYQKAERLAREEHIPVVVHVRECTQPQGHSTSGSHERYKSKERLEWEKKMDNIESFRSWILDFEVSEGDQVLNIATEEQLSELDKKAKKEAKAGQKSAWAVYTSQIDDLKNAAVPLLKNLAESSANKNAILEEINALSTKLSTYKRDVFHTVRKSLRLSINENTSARTALINWLNHAMAKQRENYSSYLYFETPEQLPAAVAPVISEDSELVDGRVVLRDNFKEIFKNNPKVLVFGEDSGNIGDVNQGLEGLQQIYGESRVSDTGIREATILGQGIGLAMRGLRPIAEIQYLDYVLYCLQGMSDDLATVLYRTNGRQKAPVIVRTRGHRLEGIWHAGSPMGGILNLVRGMYVLVPRDLTKAAGFYNSLLKTNTPAIVVESLNGYRLKEKMPSNLGEFTTPIGEVEITKEGKDVTLLTYGSTWRIVDEAAKELENFGINAEVIDVQSLIPFDNSQQIKKSLEKTNRLVIIDEDVPGGASAYMLKNILEDMDGYRLLDSKPLTITANDHRTAYATDGDYFSKPSLDDIVEKVYNLMNESNPAKFPSIFG